MREILRGGFLRKKSVETAVPLSLPEQVKNTLEKTGKIWNDKKVEDKEDRFKKESERNLPLIDAALKEPGYFSQLEVDVHFRATGMLGFLVRGQNYEPEKENESGDEKNDKIQLHKLIKRYVGGIVELRRDQLKDRYPSEDEQNYRIRLQLRNRSGIPRNYLDEVLADLGVIQSRPQGVESRSERLKSFEHLNDIREEGDKRRGGRNRV